MTDSPIKDRVSVEQAAALMQINPRNVRKAIATGRLPAKKVIGGVGGRSGEVFQIRVSDLPREAQLRYAALQDGSDNGHVDLAGYRSKFGEEGEAELMKRLDAVREMLAFTRLGQGSLMEKRKEVAERLGVSVGTLYRWEQSYKKEALGGLMDAVERADKGVPRQLCRMAQDFVHSEVCVSTKPTNRAVYGRLLKMSSDLGRSACERCPYNPDSDIRAMMMAAGTIDDTERCDRPKEGMAVPASYTTVDRYVKQIPQSVKALGRYGLQYWKANYMPKALRKKPDLVNTVWFGDHHVFDIFVIDEKTGKPVRPWLTAWMDATSGVLVGVVLTLNPNSRTIMEALKRAAGRTVDSDIWGLCVYVYTDNGKDYKCKMIEGDGLRDYPVGQLNISLTEQNALLKGLGIGVHRARPRDAWVKPIERLFGTLEERWVRGVLPGWCGNDKDERPEELNKDIRDGRLMTYKEFAAYFFNVMLPEYHAYRGDQDRSPMEIYQATEKARPQTVSWAMLHEASAMRETRRVGTTGIKFAGKVYMHPDLIPLIGQWVTITYEEKGGDSVGVMSGNKFICEAETVDRLMMVNEDPDKLAAHIERQKKAQKNDKTALRLPVERVKAINDMYAEREDVLTPYSLTTLVHERAYRARQDAKGRADDLRGKKSAEELATARKIKAELTRSGNEMIEMLRAAEG